MWLLAAAAVIVAAYLAVIFVAPVALAVGGVLAGGMAFIEYTTATAFVFRGSAAPIGHLHIEPQTTPGRRGRTPEPAYRSYYLGPVFRDYYLALRTASERGWASCFGGRPADPAAGRPERQSALTQRLVDGWAHIDAYAPVNPTAAKVITFAPMVAAMLGLVGGAIVAALVLAAVSAVFGVLLALVAVLALVTAVALRLFEVSALRIRSITLECGHCRRRATSPVYQCSHCVAVPSRPAALHRRLVPGSLGVFTRTCRCGNTLPTLLARGKWKLQGFCQYCDKPFPMRGLTTPTFHVPVVAGRQAGKTVFMMAALAGLTKQVKDNVTDDFEFADRAVLEPFNRAVAALETRSLEAIRATAPVLAMPAFNVYLGTGRRRRLMYLYDEAGERFQSETGTATLTYLEHSGGAVVIVDPFSFDAVRRHTERVVLDAVRHSPADIEDVVGRFAEGLRQSVGGSTNRKLGVRVAVVLSKCDALLESAAVPHPYEELGPAAGDSTRRAERSAAIRTWIADVAGRSGLLTKLENTFTTCEFFAVSAQDAFGARTRTGGRSSTPVRNDEPWAALRWLLEKDRS